VIIRLPPNKVEEAKESRATRGSTSVEQPTQKRTRAAKAAGARIPPKKTAPEVEEVPRPGPSRAVYLNEPSAEMAAAWVQISKGQEGEARAKEQMARGSLKFAKALQAMADALNKQNA
jgi:hypothetical protein